MNCNRPEREAITGYTSGCRCDRCKTAGTEYHREYRKRNKARIQDTRTALRQFKKTNKLLGKKS